MLVAAVWGYCATFNSQSVNGWRPVRQAVKGSIRTYIIAVSTATHLYMGRRGWDFKRRIAIIIIIIITIIKMMPIYLYTVAM